MPISWTTDLAATFARGWDASFDFGTTGDIFVSQSTGSDGNDGLTVETAKATLAGANAIAASTNVIKIRSGTYRESIVPVAGTTWEGYGTEKPVISAANLVTDWTQCTVGDEPRVGANFASIYKKTVSHTDLPNSSLSSANIYINGVRQFICREWVGDYFIPALLETATGFSRKFWERDNRQFLQATEVILDGSDRISGYKLPAVTDNYTQAQIENSLIYVYHSPNVVSLTSVASFDPLTDAITLAETFAPQGGALAPDPSFAIFNILPAMALGDFGWFDEGDGTVTLYTRPSDPLSLIAGCEVSARAFCFDVTTSNNITLNGLDLMQAAGVGINDGAVIVDTATTVETTGLTMSHCKVSRIRREGGRAAVTLGARAESVISRCTFEDIQNCSGIFLLGGNTLQVADSRISRCEFTYISNSGWLCYGQHQIIVDHNMMRYTGLAAHANKGLFYQSCYQVLAWGNIWIDCDGYLTHQDSSDIFALFNYIPGSFEVSSSGQSSRAYQDQNRLAVTPPASVNKGLFANNGMPPNSSANGVNFALAENSLTLGPIQAVSYTVEYDVINNYVHGFLLSSNGASALGLKDYNLSTAGDTVGANDTTAAITSVFTDPANGDFSLAVDSPLRTATGTSISGYITFLQGIFGTRFTDWTLDAAGKTIILSSPPLSCFVDPDDYATVNGLLHDVTP